MALIRAFRERVKKEKKAVSILAAAENEKRIGRRSIICLGFPSAAATFVSSKRGR